MDPTTARVPSSVIIPTAKPFIAPITSHLPFVSTVRRHADRSRYVSFRELCVDSDVGHVSDQDTTHFDDLVPRDAEISAVDLEMCRDANPELTRRVRHWRSRAVSLSLQKCKAGAAVSGSPA